MDVWTNVQFPVNLSNQGVTDVKHIILIRFETVEHDPF